MNRNPLNIESLLEHLGTTGVPEDTVHRYELRRELLCSRYFGDHHARQQRWNRIMTFTAPLITGGVLVLVFSVVGVSLNETDSMIVQSEPTSLVQMTEAEPIKPAKTEPNEFVDSREPVSMNEMIKFVPVQTVDYVLMR